MSAPPTTPVTPATTTASARRGSAPGRAIVPRDLAPVALWRWHQPVAALLAGTILCALLPTMLGHRAAWWTIATACTLAAAACGTLGWRTNTRRRLERTALLAMMQDLSTPNLKLQVTWSRSLRTGTPRAVLLLHSPLEPITDTRAAAAVTKAFLPVVFEVRAPGRLARLRRPKPGRIMLHATIAKEQQDTAADVARATEVADQVFGTRGHVSGTDLDKNGKLHSFTITHTAGAALTDPRAQEIITRKVSGLMPGRWSADYDLEHDKITFTRRPLLPTFVLRPCLPVTPGDTLIPEGVDENGVIQFWNFAGQFAHKLFAGKTRTGKTVALTGTMMEGARRGHRVFGIDPKRTEFLAMRDWPNVQLIATKVEDQTALLWYLRELMYERYRRIEEDGASEDDFEHILLIIDEYRQFFGNVKSWWGSIKISGMPAQCPAIDWVGDLLRMAAAARIHVVLGTQRPDADVVGGEALAIDTPICTPQGWTTMGEIQPGQQVYGPDGTPVTVTAATEVLNERPCYRVQFSDGSSLIADAQHLWQVTTTDQREGDLAEALRQELSTDIPHPSGQQPQVVTTRQLAEGLTADPAIGWAIPAAPAIQHEPADLPIDPWLLGYWLGDGHKATAAIATADPEVITRIESLGYRAPHHGRFNDGVVLGRRGQRLPGNLKQQLRDLGLLHNKHVSPIYLTGSPHQRADLLAGLLDSDGAVAIRRTGEVQSGQVTFANTNKELVDAVAELAASLGFIATVRLAHPERTETSPNSVAYGRRTRQAWTVRFTPDRQVFGIGRKQRKLAPALDHPRRATTRLRYVTAVEPVDSVPVRCITVDSDDRLYLAGRTFIATHNCRDNFSARAATGPLSPDGAEMMYPNHARIATNIPITVRGRGTYAGEDDVPKEIQFYFTPNPRTAKDPEHLALLQQLRPAQPQWERLMVHYPDRDELLAKLAEDKRKMSVEWFAVLEGTLVPYQSHIHDSATTGPDDADDDIVAEPTHTPDDGYTPPALTWPSELRIGDLMELEEAWVTITDVEADDDDQQILLSWSSADDDGMLSTSDNQQVLARHPLEEDPS